MKNSYLPLEKLDKKGIRFPIFIPYNMLENIEKYLKEDNSVILDKECLYPPSILGDCHISFKIISKENGIEIQLLEKLYEDYEELDNEIN